MKSARLTIGAELAIAGLPDHVAAQIRHSNTFANPEHERKARLGFWTGQTPPAIRLWRDTAGALVVPRGTLPIALRLCRDHGVAFDIIDNTIAPPLDVAMAPGALYPYQQRALDDLLRHPSGLLEAPTGSGKTNVLLSASARLNTPTLILTHTTALLRQTCERCYEWLGIEPGAIGAGKFGVRPVTVAMIQTLARRDLTQLAQRFGAVFIDEVHHAPAKTWAAIVNQLPARYCYGLTATAWRKDGLEPVMLRTIGPITATISQADVQQAGTVIAPDIQTVDTKFSFDLIDTSDWGAMISALVKDDDRNALIADEVRHRLTPTSRALVLTDRIDHAHALADHLKDLGHVVLTGELTKQERGEAMDAVRAGARLTIATSHLLGEGVDVPGWDLLFLTTPMAGGPRTLQAIGRVSRAAPGKRRATVVDFVDRHVPALVAAYRSRARLYDGVAA